MPFRRETDPIKNAERALEELDKRPDSPHNQRRADRALDRVTKTPTPKDAVKPFNG